ncbi:C40 family peptidase [Longirhabdus pacifica]|uniref:C40 family peptidase n=1 Tax=Longirhabdus pacifica TaxID=2305227 RepID=UPI00100880A8|nr:SH3 domain-containing C40 family peptidase [Longirhabdus pacifica]
MRKKIITGIIAGTLVFSQVPASLNFTAPDQGTVYAASTSGTVKYGVNLRKKPSTSSSKIRMLQKGEKVTILSKYNSYWYKVKDKNGNIGYASANSKYISTSNSSSSSSSSSSSTSTSSKVNKVINAGKKYLGTPYEYGSSRSNTRTFDCSDFVKQAFKDGINKTLPSNSRTQANYVKNTLNNNVKNWENLNKGDLMFFMSYRGSSKSNYTGINKSNQRVSHVGIYLGNGKILHTYSKNSGGVRIDSIEGKHWEHRFIFGGSAIK